MLLFSCFRVAFNIVATGRISEIGLRENYSTTNHAFMFGQGVYIYERTSVVDVYL